VTEPVRYTSPDDDNTRWFGFPFRDGDIVISTRSKHGTTWVQMICALLVFQTAELPAPLAQLSPWLDHLVAPRPKVYAQLAAQQHRRFIKSHTPLDGLPNDPRATYVVAARQPLDAAVSLYHHSDNIDRERLRELVGAPVPPPGGTNRPPVDEWVRLWIDADPAPRDALESLPGVMHHLSDAWARRAEPNIVLVHYDDLCDDLDAEMRRVASRLGFTIDEAVWPQLVDAARFDRMRVRADELAPDRVGVLKDRSAFFRRGRSGAGRELLTDADVARYHERVASIAPADLLSWLHRARSPDASCSP